MIVCEKCYTPRINDSSIKWGDKYYCSLECFEGHNNGESNADIIERLKDEIAELNQTIENLEDDENNTEHENHLEHIYDKINSIYALDENMKSWTKIDKVISELIEYYNDEGVYNGR